MTLYLRLLTDRYQQQLPPYYLVTLTPTTLNTVVALESPVNQAWAA